MKKVLAASLVVHAALFGLLMRTRVPAPPPVVVPAEANIEVAIETAAPIGDAKEDGPHEIATAIAAPARGIARPAPLASGAPAVDEAPVGTSSTWIVDLGVKPVGIPTVPPAAGGTSFWPTRQQAEAEERAMQLPHKDDGLKNAALAEDAAKGYGADAPVLHALEDETRRSLAPLRGSATFHAIVDATGLVTTLIITDNVGDLRGWNDARDHALVELQKKRIPLRGAKNGVALDISIVSEMRSPAGALVPEFGVKDGRLTMSGDVSNIGSKASRVVHARTTSYTPL
jgi:hypothetical protein